MSDNNNNMSIIESESKSNCVKSGICDRGLGGIDTNVMVYYQNARGLNMNIDNFYNNVTSSHYSCIVITESWLNDSMSSSEVICEDTFNVYRADRSSQYKSKGGGVLVATNTFYESKEIGIMSELNNRNIEIEITGVCLSINKVKKINIIALYIPPSINTQIFIRFIEDLTDAIETLEHDLLLMGDFNCPGLVNESVTSSKVKVLKQLTTIGQLKQYNELKNNKNNVLDLIFSSFEIVIDNPSDILTRIDPAQTPIQIMFRVFTVKKIGKNKVASSTERKLNFNKSSKELLSYDLSFVDWSVLLSCNEIHLLVDSFYSILFGVFQQSIPYIYNNCEDNSKKIKKYPVWFTNEIIHDIKLKSKYWGIYKKTGGDLCNRKFKEIRSKIKRDIISANKKYNNKLSLDIIKCPEKFWGDVKLKKSGGNNSNEIIMLIKNGVDISDNKCVANEFAMFFMSVYAGVTQLDPESTRILNNNNNDEINIFDYINTEKIISIIKNLPRKKSKGMDGVPSNIFRELSTQLCYPVSIILQKIPTTGVFPEKFKQIRVVPIYKKIGNTNDVTKYRPVSIGSSPAKTVEACLSHIIFNMIGNKIANWQHGFYPGRSTVTNLLTLIQYIYTYLTENYQVDVVYTDLSKAFDRVSFSILVKRLIDIGLPIWIVKIIQSYLVERKNFVVVNKILSSPFKPTSGVP